MKKAKKILAICIGCPGSGKSYYCQHTLHNYYHISQDNFGKKHYKKFLELLLNDEKLICVDRMNFSVEQRLRYVLPAKQFGYKISYYLFTCPYHICIKRMQQRKNHPTVNQNDHKKHRELLSFFENNYEKPQDWEFHELNEVKTGEINEKR